MADSGSPFVTWSVDGGVLLLDLHRPCGLGGVSRGMADGIAAAIALAADDPGIRVIRLRGEGRAFESEADLGPAAARSLEGDRTGTWDAAADLRRGRRFVDACMALWRSPKPVVAQVYGRCIGFGSDLVLCSDVILCAHDCRIGYSAARGYGVPTTGLWLQRIGLERTKRLLLTGDPLDGETAVAWGLASGCYDAADLDRAAIALCARMAAIPPSQLQLMKLFVNDAVEQAGIASTQSLGTLLDSVARHLPEIRPFVAAAAADAAGALHARDMPFGDHTAGPRTATTSLLE